MHLHPCKGPIVIASHTDIFLSQPLGLSLSPTSKLPRHVMAAVNQETTSVVLNQPNNSGLHIAMYVVYRLPAPHRADA